MRDTEWPTATAWYTEILTRRGTPPTGPADIHRQRPWSTVARVPTTGGTVWFKRNNPATAYEAPLIRALGTLAPNHVVVPIAVDPRRGWSLLPDAGVTLRDRAAGRFDPTTWADLLRRYAELQLAVTPHAPGLTAIGLPDLRPSRLPERFDGLLGDPAVRAALTADEHAALRGWQPRYERLCALLDGSGFGATIQHDDLHDGNVLVGADGGLRFFDFGDASLAHPFGTLLVTLRAAAGSGGLAAGDPVLLGLRDAYLACWGDPALLRATADAAVAVTKVSRALSWQRSLADADDPAEYAAAVPGWLTELLCPDVT